MGQSLPSVFNSQISGTVVVNPDGSSIAGGGAAAPAMYNLNGVATQVSRDTVTPANSRPFPVELMSASGIDIKINNANISVDLDGKYVAVTNPTPDNTGIMACANAAAPAITDQTVRLTGGIGSAATLTPANSFGLDIRSLNYEFDGTNWAMKAPTKWEKLQRAVDLVQTYTFLDPGVADERVSTIVYSSVALGAPNITETYVWAGAAGAYYLSTITRS